MTINVLMTGDVVGASGRQAVKKLLPQLRQEYNLDLVVVNAENADGLGLYISSANDLLAHGADILTLGDHIYDKSEIYEYLGHATRIVRPLNFTPTTPGLDRVMVTIGQTRVMIVSVIGILKINIYSAISPFTALDQLLSELETFSDEKATAHYPGGLPRRGYSRENTPLGLAPRRTCGRGGRYSHPCSDARPPHPAARHRQTHRHRYVRPARQQPGHETGSGPDPLCGRYALDV